MKDNLKAYLANASMTVVEAMQKIDQNTKGILFIVNKEHHLIGSVTDGDIRRWLIKTGTLSASVAQFMNPCPKYLYRGDKKSAKEYMKESGITALPIVDAYGILEEIIFISDSSSYLVEKKKQMMEGIPVIIMAGGKGTRLYPYTKILPKPLIPIGDMPILERIIHSFCKYGISEYYLAVNYKKGMIKSYFTELNPVYKIKYLEEDKPLGTAGSIRLLTKKFETPMIVTNCDILIEADYQDIFRHHQQAGNALTVVSALKNIVVPYGVLHSKEYGIVTSMEEKPRLSYFVNTGMYILNPELIEKIPKDTFFHMTDFVTVLMQEGFQVGMYPISEEAFLDMGEWEEMERMEKKLKVRAEQE